MRHKGMNEGTTFSQAHLDALSRQDTGREATLQRQLEAARERIAELEAIIRQARADFEAFVGSKSYRDWYHGDYENHVRDAIARIDQVYPREARDEP